MNQTKLEEKYTVSTGKKNWKELNETEIRLFGWLYENLNGDTLCAGAYATEIYDEIIEPLIETERKEAVIEYRINFEKGVQNVVENTVAKDRVAEIRKEVMLSLKTFMASLQDKKRLNMEHLQIFWLVIDEYLTQTEGDK